MKKTLIALLLITGFLSAQDAAQIVRTSYFEAKSGHAAKLEKGLKDHTDKFHQSADHAVNTWQVVAGRRTGQYLRTTSNEGWEGFDTYQDLPGDQAHWDRAVTPHLESTSGLSFWKFNVDYSYNPPQSTPKMFAVWLVQYKAGAWSKYRDAVLKINQANKDNKSDYQVAAYSLRIGGEGRTYAFLRPMDSWADMNPKGMGLWETLVASYGEEEAGKILGSRSEAVEKAESEVILFRPDLSTPASE